MPTYGIKAQIDFDDGNILVVFERDGKTVDHTDVSGQSLTLRNEGMDPLPITSGGGLGDESTDDIFTVTNINAIEMTDIRSAKLIVMRVTATIDAVVHTLTQIFRVVPVNSTIQAINSDGEVTVAVTRDTRDLEPAEFVWNVRSRATGVLYAPEILRIAPGETIKAGFRCLSSTILPHGAVLSSVKADPQTLSPAVSELTVALVGHDAINATFDITAASSIAVGTTTWLETTVNNSFGSGPIQLSGKIVVVEKHP